MQIIIDAYNLIKRIYSRAFVSKCQIESCIQMLAQYALIKDHKLTIVFDGGDCLWLTREHYSNVCELWWVGLGLKADDYIKQLLGEKYKYHLLVSCDRELVIYAQENKIPSIEVVFFWEFVKKAIKVSQKNNQKLKNNNQKIFLKESSVIDDLMDEFTCQKDFKEIEAQEDRSFFKKKDLSKHEIQLYTIIKKL